jgi:hypothetical protein
LHTLSARFAVETVDITFELRKPLAAAAQDTTAVTTTREISGPAGVTMPATEIEENLPAVPTGIAAAALLVCSGAAVLIVRARRGRRPVK